MKTPALSTLITCCMLITHQAVSQLEVFPWGNLRGVRVDHALVALETAFALESAGGAGERTAHYAQPSDYRNLGELQEVCAHFRQFTLVQRFSETGPGEGRLALELTAKEPAAILSGALELRIPLAPGERWKLAHAGGSIDEALLANSAGAAVALPLAGRDPALSILAASRHYAIAPAGAARAAVALDDKGDAGRDLVLSLVYAETREFRAGEVLAGAVAFKVISHPATGPVPVTLHLAEAGPAWEGIGGNFRLQFPQLDPAVIDYCLDRLPVRWSRIAMWWNEWDPDESVPPAVDYLERQLSPKLADQVALAKRLAGLGMPLIVSAWYPPEWAILKGPRRPGTYGDALDPAKTARQVASIVAYLLMLRERAGVEAALFSFNEPEIGVWIVQDPQAHVQFMRTLAQAMQAAGLATRILAADTSNATPYARSFAELACADPELLPAVAAIGFHTWGGCEPGNLVLWSRLARRHGLPLLVTEGGADSEAHRNPDLFLTDRYQFDQAELYLNLCRLGQVATIMEWQLTADYSVLDGGGTYGRQGPLAPTFRFWLLKHLGLTPAGFRHVGIDVDAPEVTGAAMASGDAGGLTVHLLNAGPAREFRLAGLPAGCRTLTPLVSRSDNGWSAGEPVDVIDGIATFRAPPRSLVTLFTPGIRAD